MKTPFEQIIDQICKPTPAMEWITSDHVTETLAEMRHEEGFNLTSWIAGSGGSTP